MPRARKNLPGEVKRSNLEPERYPQGDLFMADIISPPIRGERHSMELPFYALKRGDMATKELKFERDYGTVNIKITPSEKGRATQGDKGIVYFIVSQIRAGMKLKRKPNRRVTFMAGDLFRFLNWPYADDDNYDYPEEESP